LEIKSRTFFVTGGGSGLGTATARLIAEEGGNVVIADVNDEAGESLAGEIGEKARFRHTDVTDERSVRAAIDAALETFGGLHGLVNCAGVGPAQKLLGREGAHSLQDFRETVEGRSKSERDKSRTTHLALTTSLGLL
jgi:NAD(P)-dependent dehydrogenase (short-subunit alcohol dehydrogenase family)